MGRRLKRRERWYEIALDVMSGSQPELPRSTPYPRNARTHDMERIGSDMRKAARQVAKEHGLTVDQLKGGSSG